MPFQAPRGTEDVLPSESYRWQWLEREFLDFAKLYGYAEIRTPTFEDKALFVRSSGETSEVVNKQMYDFVDKGGREIALKPEVTAPVVRAVIEHNLCPAGTVCRFSYVSPVYRYERPQKGRLREPHQVGLELIGSPSVAADAEIIVLTVEFYKRLGLKDLNVLLNSLGRGECRKKYREALMAHASDWLKDQPEENQQRTQKNPLRLLDSKAPEVLELMKSAPSILDFLEEECKLRFDQLQCLLDEARISYTVAPGIVRGLDYYTESVFEVQSTKLGAQSALCGGGRYDDLFKELGGAQTPAVGVAMGIERALMVLEEEGLLPPGPKPDYYVAYTGEDTRREALKIAAELRAKGFATLIDIDGKSLKSQMGQADKVKVRKVVIIGENEMKDGTVTVRDLESGEQKSISRGELE